MAAVNTQGTMTSNPNFSAEVEANKLRKAMKGIGTDEGAIIEVMSSHSNEQRQEITRIYKTQFGKDLRADLKSELSGNFEDLVLALLDSPTHFDIKQLHGALSGLGTNESTLIEILCSRSTEEIAEIKKAYKTAYKKDLEKEVMSDTSGHFKRLLVALLTGNREEATAVDPAKAAADAKDFYDAGANKIGTDESTFNRLLCLRNYPQLVAMFDEYRKQYGREIEQVIKSETSGDVGNGYLAIVQIAKNKPAYFAERLYKSMKGAGTNDKVLIRVVVSRCEVDMVQIKEEFQRKYGKTLGSFIAGDTSGDYKKLLLKLIKDS